MRAGWRTCYGWEFYPKDTSIRKHDRPVRDLLRKRGQMVRQRTTNLLSIQNLFSRNTGSSMSANRIKRLDGQEVDELVPNGDLALAIKANLAMLRVPMSRSTFLEKTVMRASETQTSVQLSQDGSWDRRHSSSDDHAGDRRDQEISQCGGLCLVLPLCGQQKDQQRQEKRQRQY